MQKLTTVLCHKIPQIFSSDEKAIDLCNTEEQGMEVGANLGINVVKLSIY